MDNMKKIFALVMVMSILGGILAGCSKGEDAGGTTTGTSTTGTTGDATK